jgi:putative AdoMet-dependent methyltransferase
MTVHNQSYILKTAMSPDKWGFDEWAETYDADVVRAADVEDWVFRDYERVLDRVVEYCGLDENEYSSVIDIGTGTGNLASRFLERRIRVIGLDPSEPMRKICEQKFPEMMVVEGDFLNIPLYLPHVDLIVSAYAFHHLTAAEKVAAVIEMKRALKPKGGVVIADLMFRNAAEERRIKQALYEVGRDDILKELEGEYPGHFEALTVIFNEEGFSFRGERLTESVWIIGAFR